MHRAPYLLLLATAFLATLASCGGGGGGGTQQIELAACAVPQRFPGLARDAPAELTTVSNSPIAFPIASDVALRLEDAATSLLSRSDAPGFTAAIVVPGAGRWSTVRGLARTEPAEPASEGTLFYWASVGKAATAILILQLVDEGRLRLDDRLDRWFPQAPNAARITLTHLLTHTSGLASNPTDSPLTPRYQTPEELLAALPSLSPSFCPGGGWLYSNTGYLLLGLIAEKASGSPYHELVERKIARPLALEGFRALRPGEMPPELAAAHDGRAPRPDLGMSTRLGMGNVIARADDMVSFWRAVMTGELLQTATARRQWQVLYPMDMPGAADMWYGQGVMRIEWLDDQQRRRTWLGHLGGTPHANAMVAFDPLAGAYVAVAVNSKASSVAIAAELLKALAPR